MSQLLLVIGNKNYSSWSLRPWILLRHLGLAFDEVQVRLSTPSSKSEIAQHGPHGRVPILKHGDLTVWESLAICEYIAELAGAGWPVDRAARAMARAACAEMHAGFETLRSSWPMNARARNRRTAMTPALKGDVDRIDELWMDCRRRFGAAGPWLFGEYSVADAMYAPVVLRFNTYGAQLSEGSRWYFATALADSALQEWISAAREETWVIEDEEVG
ncbi:MAG TPA: glutathione S-transferase family protein [Steroidobacteraceae bacterium]|nr:glutathione S-transferase family protein [Steroidobacteraceae bacterium]